MGAPPPPNVRTMAAKLFYTTVAQSLICWHMCKILGGAFSTSFSMGAGQLYADIYDDSYPLYHVSVLSEQFKEDRQRWNRQHQGANPITVFSKSYCP